ncbi:MAG TPA: hypothetical protein VN840_07575 [Streptosporangiaceae bacterium]|nr:hypothetical protein [Streptosporangiaceae bacterium]
MSQPPEGTAPGPDEIDRGLREIIAGVGGDAAVREPSAAERSRRPAQPVQAKRLGWRNARKARRLRRPVPEPGHRPRRGGTGRSPAAGRWQPAPQRRSRRSQRAWTITKRLTALVLFLGLLYGLHLLGFGPH